MLGKIIIVNTNSISNLAQNNNNNVLIIKNYNNIVELEKSKSLRKHENFVNGAIEISPLAIGKTKSK